MAVEDSQTPVHVVGMTTPKPISSDRQDEVRAMLAAGNTVELAMDATAIIEGLLAELDRKDEVLTRQGRNIGQMAGNNDLLQARVRQTEPVISAALRWFAQPDATSKAALDGAMHELVSELMLTATGTVDDGSLN